MTLQQLKYTDAICVGIIRRQVIDLSLPGRTFAAAVRNHASR
jgi:hypothetical protein